MGCIWRFMGGNEILHSFFKLLLNAFFLHPNQYWTPPPAAHILQWDLVCCTFTQTHRNRHTRTRERTHILCTMRGLTTATVAMVTTLHVWIKHYITAKATLSPSESVSVPLSFAFLLHLLCSLLLYQNVQACEEMKMFDKDSTQDGVCTLDLRLLAAAMIVML